MARFRWEGEGEAGEMLAKMGRPVIKRIVEAVADAAVSHMQERINSMHRITGDMAAGVKKAGFVETLGGGSEDVYPQDNDRFGTRNATKAYVINYGRGGTRRQGKMGDRFIDRDPDVEKIVHGAMQAESDRILTEIGAG